LDTAEIFARFANGGACAAATECESGFCVDGVCCDALCDGLCRACTAAKKESGMDGVCGPVAAHSDPDGECTDDGAPSCANDGYCDGAGACEKYARTSCTPEPCTSTADCASGNCADGICCNEACTGPCETCAKAKGASQDGICQPVPKGTDP